MCRLTRLLILVAASQATLVLPMVQAAQPAVVERQVVWEIDNVKWIGGQGVTVLGGPKVIETPQGKGVEFDGVDDGLVVPQQPVAAMRQFTAEVIFRPAADGPKEQRFFHLQEAEGDDRVLFETRLTPDGKWFLDTFIKSGEASVTLYAEKFPHPLDQWHHAAITVDGQTMRHYVNGSLEMQSPLAFEPLTAGESSIGVRLNKVFWYKGAIRKARFTPRVLQPNEFLKP